MNGSVTTSGRDRPNLPSTSAIWPTAPPPTCSMRGAAMLAFTAVMARSSERRSFTQAPDGKSRHGCRLPPGRRAVGAITRPLRRPPPAVAHRAPDASPPSGDVARFDHLARRRQLLGAVAGGEVAVAPPPQRRHLLAAAIDHERAAGVEAAAEGGFIGLGTSPPGSCRAPWRCGSGRGIAVISVRV